MVTEGVKNLRKIQIGTEVTPGTPVAATSLWRGEGTAEDTRTINEVDEDIGNLAPTNRTNISALATSLTWDEVAATFEQLPYIFEAGVDRETPTVDGVGTGFIYAYSMNTTTPADPRTYTMEFGDNQQAEEANFFYVESFTLAGVAGEPLTMSAEWRGRESTKTTYTGAISTPAVTDLLFGNCKLYIDADAGTIGTTQITNTFLGFSLTVTSGFMGVLTGDGQLDFSFLKSAGRANDMEVLLELTLEHDSNSVAEKDDWRTQTPKLIRIENIGPALATPAAETNKSLQIDVAGQWQVFPALDEQDGNDIYTATFKGMFSSVADAYVDFRVVNELAALP